MRYGALAGARGEAVGFATLRQHRRVVDQHGHTQPDAAVGCGPAAGVVVIRPDRFALNGTPETCQVCEGGGGEGVEGEGQVT